MKDVKTDVKGLGYLDESSLKGLSLKHRGRKKKIGGFGIGVMEEEEEYDVYNDLEGDEPHMVSVVTGDEEPRKIIEEVIRFISERGRSKELIENELLRLDQRDLIKYVN